ncbi:Zinc transporter ZIP10 [Paragonimus heterotremus]|uniref:Zinc transporter ZIP10 n=1 Tax=Paragonimus heterotremus TaxID=100268 RepID=A0A8J4TM75_9TREM|nr:Zinc transporter ZIP10 [Paragonimus heterotremus]
MFLLGLYYLLVWQSASANLPEATIQNWCRTFRGPPSKPLNQAFDFPHLVEHLNEDLKTTVTLEQISDWYNQSQIPSIKQTETNFVEFCEQAYRKILEIANSTDSSGLFGYNFLNVRPKVWAASLIAIFVVSAVGLLGVGVVPLVQKMFYNQVIQYLVALAVGTLTGDAMLHLIPHAISAGEGHSHGAPAEDEVNRERLAVYKGLVALGGVYFFFMAEKTLGFVSEYRAEKRLEEEDRQRAMRNPRRSTDVRRLSGFRPSLTPGSLMVPRQKRRLSQLDPTTCRRASRAMSLVNEDILTTGLSSKAMRSIDILYRYAEEDAQEDEKQSEIEDDEETHLVVHKKPPRDETAKHVDSNVTSSKANITSAVTLSVPKVVVVVDPDDDDKKESLSPDKKADGHEHLEDKKEHGHDHSHEVPGSVASVAWMVILGDGLHNFTDGMAIGKFWVFPTGAAFAQSISGGLSTAVAVFCHELPHELGDFAVLLKTGMRIKDALFFNVVSSILSLFGMLVGIAVGNIASASYWIFAITAGTFIYIALVDMLPELSTAELRPGQTRVGQIFLQSFGLLTGVGIMLCIALFEDKIKVIID